MAHIPDGVLSVPVLAGGAALAVAGIGWGVPLIPLLRWAEREPDDKTKA